MNDLGLSKRFAELLQPPKLGELREDIALTDLHIDDLLKPALGPDSTPATRQEFRDAIEQRRKLVDSLRRTR